MLATGRAKPFECQAPLLGADGRLSGHPAFTVESTACGLVASPGSRSRPSTFSWLPWVLLVLMPSAAESLRLRADAEARDLEPGRHSGAGAPAFNRKQRWMVYPFQLFLQSHGWSLDQFFGGAEPADRSALVTGFLASALTSVMPGARRGWRWNSAKVFTTWVNNACAERSLPRPAVPDSYLWAFLPSTWGQLVQQGHVCPILGGC